MPKDAIDGALRLYAKICQLHRHREAYTTTNEPNERNRTHFASRYRSLALLVFGGLGDLCGELTVYVMRLGSNWPG